MRTVRLTLLLLLPCLFLSGCSQSAQLEDRAFAIVLGVDRLEDGVELSAQFSKLSSGSPGESSGGESGGKNSQYLQASAKGQTFFEALDFLELALPRDLDLSQVKLIVISEEMARSEMLTEITQAIVKTYRLYSTAYFVICQGAAKEFVEAQQPVIGSRISSGILAMFEHYQNIGYIRETSFANFFYGIDSAYYDPVAVYAGLQKGENPPIEIREGELILPESLPAESEDKSAYVGTALFRHGRMIGTLDGRQTTLFNLLVDSDAEFLYGVDDLQLTIQALHAPRISVVLSGAVPRIRVELLLKCTSFSDELDAQAASVAIRRDLEAVVKHCQELGVEPFHFSERAIRQFPTYREWEKYDWYARFPDAQVEIDVGLIQSDA